LATKVISMMLKRGRIHGKLPNGGDQARGPGSKGCGRARMRFRDLARVAGLGLMSLLLMGGIGFSQPQQPYQEMGQEGPMLHEPPRGPAASVEDQYPEMGVPIELLHSGRGFAIKDNESWVFRLNIERVRPIEPTAVMLLLASNRSLEEIRDEIRAKDGGATYRGSVKLQRSIYPLVNINIATPADNATVDADVAAPALGSSSNSEASIAGHISLKIAPFKGSLMGKGELTMNSGPDAGRYQILLEMTPPAREMRKRDAWG
jgi:hypothetical protein